MRLLSSRSWGQQVCDLSQAVLWRETKWGVVRPQRDYGRFSLVVGVAARSGPMTQTRTALRSAGRSDGTAWLVSLASLISIVCLSRCLLQVLKSRSFYTQQGSQQNNNNGTQPAGLADSVRRSFFFFLSVPTTFTSSNCDSFGNRSLNPSSGDIQLADKLLIGVSTPPDRHTNCYVQQHTAEHRWSAASLLVSSSQVKPLTVRLSTMKFIKKEKKGDQCFNSNMWMELFDFGEVVYQPYITWRFIWCDAKCQVSEENEYITKKEFTFLKSCRLTS